MTSSEPLADDPLDDLPQISRLEARVESHLRRSAVHDALAAAFAWISEHLGAELEIGWPRLLQRPSGVLRPGVVIQLDWPGQAAQPALGIETLLAHALVDRLLGFDRAEGAERRQVTPVEWGILTYVAAITLDDLCRRLDPSGLPDLTLDRVGPDPIRLDPHTEIWTLQWPVRLGTTTSNARLWLPRHLLIALLARGESRPWPALPVDGWRRYAALGGRWVAVGGAVLLRHGLASLRPGLVCVPEGAPLHGSPQAIEGHLELVPEGPSPRVGFPATAVAGGAGFTLQLRGPLRPHFPSSETSVMATPPVGSPEQDASAAAPVSLVVELGRVELSLERLAALQGGDLIELGRHSREPVELTSNGRLVARGELVRIDTELGVRITSVFL